MSNNITTTNKFKVITLLGIRPDYIRMRKIIQLLDKGQKNNNYEHILVHSGQHYDPELYEIFLKELNIRKPDIDLKVGLSLKKSGTSNHAYQVALLSERVFDLIEKVKPNLIIYLGDTNTVLSSLTTARCGVPIVHIEGGGRSFDWRMPEEKNRILIDHLSDAIYCYLDRYKEILIHEGIDEFRIKVTGNIIVDPLNDFAEEIEKNKILDILDIKEKKFILATIHREENISIKKILKNKLEDILRFAKKNKLSVVFPLMPRTKQAIEKFGLEKMMQNNNFLITKPLGFIEFAKLEKTAKLIVSDSGTVQEEALILGTPCVICRRSTERPETIWAGATILEGFEDKNTLYNAIKKSLNMKANWNKNILNPQNGSPSERIYKNLTNKIQNSFFKESRSIENIKNNRFVSDVYNIK